MTKKPRKTSKRKDGARLNKEGRESPLEVFQLRQEYYSKLARDEIALGELGSREKIDGYLRLAQEAAEALAPYRHARLQATAVEVSGTMRYVARMPTPCATIEEWASRYPPEQFREEALKPIVEITVPKPAPVMIPNWLSGKLS